MQAPARPRLSRYATSGAASLNLTPLIDVVLLLPIFFMLTSPMVLRSAWAEITPPKTDAPRPVSGTADHVEIDAQDRVRLNGAAVGPATLRRELRRSRRRSPRVTVMADAAASFGMIVEVVDACRGADMEVDFFASPRKP